MYVLFVPVEVLYVEMASESECVFSFMLRSFLLADATCSSGILVLSLLLRNISEVSPWSHVRGIFTYVNRKASTTCRSVCFFVFGPVTHSPVLVSLNNHPVSSPIQQGSTYSKKLLIQVKEVEVHCQTLYLL
jgi:hypothetical protein